MLEIVNSAELKTEVHRFKAGYHRDVAKQHEQAAASALHDKNDALMAHHIGLASDHARQAAYYASLVEPYFH
jgi:hypothetical protein